MIDIIITSVLITLLILFYLQILKPKWNAKIQNRNTAFQTTIKKQSTTDRDIDFDCNG